MPGAGNESNGLRLLVWLAVFMCTFTGRTSSQTPQGFLTVALSDMQARPSDLSAVSVSADGRFVAFASYARLTEDDTNTVSDIYVLDRATRAVTLETPASASRGHQGFATAPHLSSTGRFLVYETVDDSTPMPIRIAMLRDRLTGVTRPLQRGGELPDGGVGVACISSGGDAVAFGSSATNLVEGPDANGGAEDVYLVDVSSMQFRRVSVDSSGRQSAVGESFSPAISADGRYVAFSSTASLDGVAPARRVVELYLRDTQLGVTTRISVAADGGLANGPSYGASISGDGRYVAFVSGATNLVKRRDSNRAPDVYLRDTVTRITELVSHNRSGASANGASSHPAISQDGRVIVFQSEASDLICGARCTASDKDINLVADIFVHDRARGTTTRISRGSAGWMEPSMGPAIDASGTVIAFSSRHPRDSADDRDDYDLFVWSSDRPLVQ